jgi:hypothetical protein
MNVRIESGKLLVPLKPEGMRDQYQLHRARIAIFDLWRDLDNHPSANIVTFVRDCKIATPFKNVVNPR